MDANKIITRKKKKGISFFRLLVGNILESIVGFLPFVYVALGAYTLMYSIGINNIMPFAIYLASLFFVIKIQQTYNEYIELKERERYINERC